MTAEFDPAAFRDRLARDLDLPAASLDRLAVALGLAHGVSATRPVAVHPDLDGFAGGPVFAPLLAARGVDGGPTLARAAAAGYALLSDGVDAADGDARVALARLAAGPAASPVGPAPGAVAPITVPIGEGSSGPVTWTVNRESGRRTNANVRIAGAQGKGKTQFLMHLLAAIAARSPRTGLILLDYKGDLSADAPFVAAVGARVIRPEREPVPINPFDVPSEVNVRLVPAEVAELLASLQPGMGQVQRLLVRRGLEAAYGESVSAGGPGPTARQVAAAVAEVYAGEARAADSVTAWMDHLAELGLFAERTAGSAEDFLRGRWIIDLSALQSLRNVVAFVLLHWTSRAVQALPDSTLAPGAIREIRSIVAVDEAHHYLRARCRPVLDLLRIGRSKGVPVFLSSQSLSDFKEHTETDQLFAGTYVLGHGMPPDARTVQGALGLPAAEAARAAARTCQLEQFEALAPDDAGSARPAPLKLRAFFERRWRP
ncbi:type IV secretion system DNA-binding domain-containing protein [Myxococcota bacterium]|nr:type IV secretion system DNA-binding domain-containing protein [Myxococcota bacterium]